MVPGNFGALEWKCLVELIATPKEGRRRKEKGERRKEKGGGRRKEGGLRKDEGGRRRRPVVVTVV